MSKGVYREIEFRKVLKEVQKNEKNQRLRRYRVEYEKLLNEYVKSCHQEKRLVHQLKNLRKEIRLKHDGTSKLKKSIEEKRKNFLDLHSDSTLTDKEIERTKQVIHTRAVRIERLHKGVEEANELMKVGIGMGERTDERIKTLTYEVDQLRYRRNQHHLKLEDYVNGHSSCHYEKNRIRSQEQVLEKELAKQKTEREKLLKMMEFYGQKSLDFQNTINISKKTKTEYEHRRNDFLDELARGRDRQKILQSEQTELVNKMKEAFMNALFTRNEMRKTKQELRLKVGENSILEVQKSHLSSELERAHEEDDMVNRQLTACHKKLEEIREDVERLNVESTKEHRRKKGIMKELFSSKGVLQSKLKIFESHRFEVDDLKTRHDLFKQSEELLIRERKGMETKIFVKLGERRNLGLEVSSFKNQNQSNFEDFVSIQKEISTLRYQSSLSSQNLRLAEEKYNTAHLTIEKDQMDIKLAVQRGRKERFLVESIAFDRNLRYKRWKEIDSEINIAEEKYDGYNGTIQVARKEVAGMDRRLIRQDEEKMKYEDSLVKRKEALEKIKKLIRQKRKVRKKSYQEVLKLEKIITETEVEKKRQVDEMMRIQNDRDMLGMHLVRRNQEIDEICDKLRLQQSMMVLHERKYQERYDKVEALRFKSEQMKQQHEYAAAHIQKYDHLHGELKSLRDELLLQKNKISFLNEEIGRKINIHPWRDSSEKKNYKLVKRKVRLRAKVSKNKERLKRVDEEIKKKEIQFIELKKGIRKQPGAGEAAHIIELKKNLQEKRKQNVFLKKDLEQVKNQCKVEKLIQSDLGEEQERIKRKWLKSKMNYSNSKNSINSQEEEDHEMIVPTIEPNLEETEGEEVETSQEEVIEKSHDESQKN